jgi:hypothetical protein
MGMKKLCVALVAIALGAVMVAPASAAQDGNDIIEITSAASGQCLQPGDASEHPGLAVGTCTGEQRQRWEQIPVGGGHLLRNLATRQCLDGRFSLANWWCDDEATTQYGQFVPDASGTVRIKYGELYADTSSGVWPRDLADTDHQRWRVRKTGTTTRADTTGQVVRIENVTNRGCVSVRDGLFLEPKPCADVPEQKFQRVELGAGGTALRSVLTGKCVTWRSAASFSVNAVPDCDPADVKQQWTFETNKTGATRIRASADARYLTPASPSVLVYERQTSPNNNTWQSWYVTAA